MVKRFIRWVSRYPKAEHLHKNCQGLDVPEDENYCCSHCGCCPCWSWRCGWCLWEKRGFRQLVDWAYKGYKF
jgi:hypothetical protein